MNEKFLFWLVGFVCYCSATFIVLRVYKRKIRAGEDPSFWDALAGKAPLPLQQEDPFGLSDAEREESERDFEFNIILRSLVLLFILSFAYFYNDFEFRSFRIDLGQINEKTQQLKLQRGKDLFIFQAERELAVSMKVLGAQANPFKKDLGQLSFITHIFLIRPFDKNSRELFDKFICEMQYHDQTSMAQIIAVDRRIKSKLDQFSRQEGIRCASLTFVPLELKKQFHQGLERQAFQVDAGGDYQYDLQKFLAVTDLETVKCP